MHPTFEWEGARFLWRARRGRSAVTAREAPTQAPEEYSADPIANISEVATVAGRGDFRCSYETSRPPPWSPSHATHVSQAPRVSCKGSVSAACPFSTGRDSTGL